VFSYLPRRIGVWSSHFSQLVIPGDSRLIGEKALEEKRIENAIAYLRMAEYFTFANNPNKIKTYDRAREMFCDFHSQEFKNGKIT
jgi:hypothetical protein